MSSDRTADPERATLALAHALRTPLTSLSLGLGLLSEGTLGPLNERQRDVVRTLTSEIARLGLLVDRALDTDRLGSYAGPLDRVAVDLGDLVRDAARPIEAQAREKGVRVEEALAAGARVIADPVKLAWVATSLMGNALRFSPPGSAITARVVASAGEASLEVGDAGPGVPLDQADRVFGRDGGRALFLAREIVEAHGGVIHVRPGAARGSVFTVRLPIAEEREAR